jgi:hypothetical protein
VWGNGDRNSGSAGHDPASDWQAIRDAGDIQFSVVPPSPPSQPPAWLEQLGQWLRDLLEPLGKALGVSWPVVEKVLIALSAVLVLVILWRLAQPLLERWRQRRPAAPAPEWAPERAAAVALLEDADRLAAQGHYGAAAHLLLRRSVHHIAEARPGWLHPASTAREIATLPQLPARARDAFAVIAGRVERSLFALRALDAGDWQAARAAYAEFALQDITGAGASAGAAA